MGVRPYAFTIVCRLVQMSCKNIRKRIYSKKYCLVRAITLLVTNIVEGVKYTCIIMKVCFVHIVVCSQSKCIKYIVI